MKICIPHRTSAGVTLLAALALALPSTPSSAQSARDRLDALEARMAQAEAVLQGQALAELSTRIDELSTQIRALRGELESQGEQQALLRRQVSELATELDRRLAAPAVVAAPAVSAPAVSAPAVVAAVTAPEGPDTLGPVQRYQLAFEALRASDHAKATAGFEDMISRYPEHALATNARYWLGRSLLLQNEPARAVEAFKGALASGTLDASRAPDALLRKGQAELQLGRRDDARTTLGELVARYPDGEPARQARLLLAP